MRYLVVIVGLLTLGAGGAGAEEPSEVSYGLPPGGIEVHLPTPPQEKLAGADILVERWNPAGPSTQGLDTKGWEPGAPDRIPAPLPYTTPAMSWVPGAPSAVPVRTWSPGQPSRIVVHGAY
jgi:hypothetical protein